LQLKIRSVATDNLRAASNYLTKQFAFYALRNDCDELLDRVSNDAGAKMGTTNLAAPIRAEETYLTHKNCARPGRPIMQAFLQSVFSDRRVSFATPVEVYANRKTLR